MVLIEDAPRLGDVDRLLLGKRPRQLDQPVEIGARHAVFAGGLRHALQAAQFLARLILDLLGHAGLGDRLVELGHLGGLALLALAELALDRRHLLAQQHLALTLVERRLGLAADLLRQPQDFDAMGEQARHLVHAGGNVDRLQDLLLLLRLHVHVGDSEIGELRGRLDRLDGGHEFGRRLRQQLQRFHGLRPEVDEPCLDLRSARVRLRDLHDARDEEGPAVQVFGDLKASLALADEMVRALQRSVRLVLTRQQMYGLCNRPATIERVALGATADGTLDAVIHEAIATTSQYEDFSRNDTGWSGLLYKSPNAKYVHRLARLDLPTPCDMRAPGAATGVYGLECAMDELAVALKLDPLELRLRCYSDRDQHEDIPYTSKELRECYRQGAAAFGWDKRDPQPRSMRDGSELVGLGVATGVWEALQMESAVRIVLTANGHAEIASAFSDIGTGTYTIVAQITADLLGLPLDNITVKLGDSTLPQAPVEGGSWTAASVSHAIAKTAGELRKELLRVAKTMPGSQLAAAKADGVALIDGKIVDKKDTRRSVSIADAMRHRRLDRIERESTNTFDNGNSHARNTHSAIFAEVRVDEELGVIRVTRVVNAVAAGRILNSKTAHSQIVGGVVWGIGMALHEETQVDHALGRVMNANIAEYLLPVNADVHDIKVIFVDEPDEIINPLGIKGVGEIGIVGVAAAIANAVFHATGKRVRDLPITLDKLMK